MKKLVLISFLGIVVNTTWMSIAALKYNWDAVCGYGAALLWTFCLLIASMKIVSMEKEREALIEELEERNETEDEK